MKQPNVIASMLDDLFKQQVITTAICIGHTHEQYDLEEINWQYFNVTELLSLPFQQRYDLGLVFLTDRLFQEHSVAAMTQTLVKLRDLMAKRMLVVARDEDATLLRALGLTQLIQQQDNFALWQFNILNYKHVPDWFNSKYWANPENWNKYRW